MNIPLKLIFKTFLMTLIVLSGGSVWAASCHGGGGGETTVLSAGQKVQFGMATSYRVIQGSFDPYGRYQSLDSDSSSRFLTTTWNGGIRLNEAWQLGWAIPLIHIQRELRGNPYSATSLGDSVLETRYTVLEDFGRLSYFPELNVLTGIRLPLGTSVYDTSDVRGMDVVGDGVSTIHGGVNISKLVRPLRLSLGGTFYYPWEKRVTKMRGIAVAEPYALKSGNRILLEESLSYLITNHWNSSVGIKELWSLKSNRNGETINGSASRIFSTLMSLGYAVDVSWNVALGYETLFPFYKYAVNQPNAHTASVAVQYGVF